MNLRKITFGALFLSLVGTQLSIASDKTNNEIKEESNSSLIERNKSVSPQTAPIETSVTPSTASLNESFLTPDRAYILKGAVTGAVAFPVCLACGWVASCLGGRYYVGYLIDNYPFYVIPPVLLGVGALLGASWSADMLQDSKKLGLKKAV